MAEAVANSPNAPPGKHTSAAEPVLPLILRQPEGVLSLASIRAYLTEPRDVTTSELILETFIPLDDGTRAILEKINNTL